MKREAIKKMMELLILIREIERLTRREWDGLRLELVKFIEELDSDDPPEVDGDHHNNLKGPTDAEYRSRIDRQDRPPFSEL